MMTRSVDIVLDFDGTVVKHRYPAVGEDIGAVPVLRKLLLNGHHLLLNTMRSRNSNGVDTLQPAIDWFAQNNLPLYGINENPRQKEWTESPKVFGSVYIDDGALGAPLKADNGEAYIDWSLASIHLFARGVLTKQDLEDLVKKGTVRFEHINLLSYKSNN